MKARRVEIVCGEGPFFGTGHAGRMKSLEAMLSRDGLLASTRFIRDYEELKSTGMYDVSILDARDADPSRLKSDKIIAIDNRHANRMNLQNSGVLFFDTLPHPECPYPEILENILIAPDLGSISFRPQNGRVLIYTGSFEMGAAFNGSLEAFAKNNRHIQIIKIGRESVSDCECHTRLERESYLELLSRCEFVFSYFGMTLFEAWYLGAIPVLLAPPAAVHVDLAADLSQKSGIPVLERYFPDEWDSILKRKKMPREKIGGYGYQKILNLI